MNHPEYGSHENDVLLRSTPGKNGSSSINHHEHEHQHHSSIKTQASSFVEDARAFAPGSIPHSMVLALTIGIVCGVACWLYYTAMWWLLDYIWHTLPVQIWGVTMMVMMMQGQEEENSNNSILGDEQHWWYMLWIPIVGLVMALGVGLTVRFVGDPGDLPYTIKRVHEQAYVTMDHVLPNVVAGLFSITAGASLGPEAPLVAICAALGGFVSRVGFRTTKRNLIRKHTLMGMAGALAAFFGAPLGGSFFALEVNSRFGVEYFEHTIEAILCGEITLAVFRHLAGLPIEPIWKIADVVMSGTSSLEILYGVLLGLVGAGIAYLFNVFHMKVISIFRKLHLLDDNSLAIRRALLGAVVVMSIGILIPHTMFWGEAEFQTIATLSPASTLRHVWPTSGLIGFEMNSFVTCLIVGIAKLIAISFSVASGFRGGYIFPSFAVAAAFGRAIYFICPFIPVQLCVLCLAAALNVALTRTAVATTLILCYLSGEQSSMSSILAASLVSLFVTGYMYFIPTQTTREDMNEAIFLSYTTLDRSECCALDRVSHGEIIIESSHSARLSRNLRASISINSILLPPVIDDDDAGADDDEGMLE